MALALEARAMKDDIMIGDTPKAMNRRRRLKGVQCSGRLWKHSRLIDVYGLIGDAEIANYHVFTMVRNPWDRLLSYYSWLKAQDFEHIAVSHAKALNFSEFIRAPAVAEVLRASPYSSYVTDRSGRNVCRSFVRLENLAQDVQKLEESLGFKIGPLPFANPSNRAKNHQSAYSPADKDWIGQICAEDIQKFGYKF